MLDTPNWDDLKRAAENLVDDAWDDNPQLAQNAVLHKSDNYKQRIFETVMETLYGPSFFDGFYNPRVDEVDT
jgi:hypothetical protein